MSAAAKKKVTLKELLARVTDGNRHGEIQTGRPVGREVW
jgi:antitoxin component of MazEF toxin-antitoxin module